MADVEKFSVSHDDKIASPDDPTCYYTATIDRQAQDESDPAADPDYRTGWRTWLVVVALAFSVVGATLTNQVNTTIRYQVGAVGGVALASWIANSMFLLTLAFGPVLGNLSDRIGKRRTVLGGCALGIVGTAVSGRASSIGQIIAGQCITGIADAGCLTAVAAYQEVVPNRGRGWSQGVATTINSAVALAATFIYASFVSSGVGGGWPSAYYFACAWFAFTGILVGILYWPPKPQLARRHSLSELLHSFDFGGMLLFAGSIAAIVIGLTFAPDTYAWSSWQVILSLCLGFAGLVVFGLYEAYVQKDGLFDTRLCQNRNFASLLAVSAIDGMLLLGANVMLAQEIQSVFTPDALSAGVVLLPYLAGTTVMCLPAAWVMTYLRDIRWPLVGALLWTALFVGLVALVDATDAGKMKLQAFTCLAGCGLAFTTVLPPAGVTLSVPGYLLGSASTLTQATRALGGIVGVTISKLATYLPEEVAPVLAANAIPAAELDKIVTLLGIPDPTVLLGSGLPGPVIGALEGALAVANARAYSLVWVTLAVLVAAAAIPCCFLRSVSSALSSHHVESALETSEIRTRQLKQEI